VPLYYDIRKKQKQLDNRSVNQWLGDVGIGADSGFGRLMQSTHLAEWGLNGDEGSALNLIYILAWNGRALDPISGLDQTYQIKGGNDTLATALAAEIGEGRIELDRKLTAITGSAGGPYTLTFERGDPVTAPKVILAIPHTTLRDVDIDRRIRKAFSRAKKEMVNDFGMAQTNKLQIQFDSKFYLDAFTSPNGLDIKPNGNIYTDPGDVYVNYAWDETFGQRRLNPSEKGIIVCFPSLDRAQAMHSQGLNVPAHSSDIDEFVAQLEQCIPGASDPNIALAANWILNPWSKGAYGAFYAGQWTTINGAGEEVVGQNLHFAGEWTDVDWQGYLEGAILSGERAAREVWQSA
jgi:monoamine oxidase